MILLSAFLLAATPAPAERPDDMVEAFKQACMKGEARFAPGGVSAIEAAGLPPLAVGYLAPTRPRKLGPVTSVDRYRITLDGAAGFLIVERRRGPPEGARTCTLIGKPMEFMPTLERIQPGTTAALPPFARSGTTSFEVASPLGYYLRVQSLGEGYVALQTASMDVGERRRLVHRLPRPREVKIEPGGTSR